MRTFIRPSRLLLAPLAALAALACTVGPAFAGVARPAELAPSVTLYYHAGDLANAQGARALYRGIQQAARQVCPQADSMDLPAFEYSRACQRQAVARAMRQIGAPQLAALAPRSVRAD